MPPRKARKRKAEGEEEGEGEEEEEDDDENWKKSQVKQLESQIEDEEAFRRSTALDARAVFITFLEILKSERDARTAEELNELASASVLFTDEVGAMLRADPHVAFRDGRYRWSPEIHVHNKEELLHTVYACGQRGLSTEHIQNSYEGLERDIDELARDRAILRWRGGVLLHGKAAKGSFVLFPNKRFGEGGERDAQEASLEEKRAFLGIDVSGFRGSSDAGAGQAAAQRWEIRPVQAEAPPVLPKARRQDKRKKGGGREKSSLQTNAHMENPGAAVDLSLEVRRRGSEKKKKRKL